MAVPPIYIDASDLRRQAEEFRRAPKAVEQATVRTINRGGDAGTTAARKALRQQTGISDRDTRRSRGLATKKATAKDQTYDLIARSKWTPLGYFDPKQTPQGVSAAPWNRRTVFPRTFLLTMRNGYTGVFQRDETAPREVYTTRSGKKKERPKLRQLWGPSLAKELERGGVPGAFTDRARQVMADRFPHELDFALGKIIGKGRKR